MLKVFFHPQKKRVKAPLRCPLEHVSNETLLVTQIPQLSGIEDKTAAQSYQLKNDTSHLEMYQQYYFSVC